MQNNNIKALSELIEKDTPKQISRVNHFFTLPAEQIAEKIKECISSGFFEQEIVLSLRIIAHPFPESRYGIEISNIHTKRTVVTIWMEDLVEETGAAWSPTAFIKAVGSEIDLASRMNDVCDILNSDKQKHIFLVDYKCQYAPFVLSDISCFNEMGYDDDTVSFCDMVQKKYMKAFPHAAQLCKDAKEQGRSYYELYCSETKGSCQYEECPEPKKHAGYRRFVIPAVCIGLACIGSFLFVKLSPFITKARRYYGMRDKR